MSNPQYYPLIPIAIPLILLFLTGCGKSAISASEPSPAHATSVNPELNSYKQYEAEFKAFQALHPPRLPPSAIGLAVDQSASMSTAQVAPVTLKDLQPVFDALSRQGGVLAVMAICDRSNRPLSRVTLPEPPRLDMSQLKVEPPPEKPRGDRGNPFQHQQALKAYRQSLKAKEQEIAKARQRLKDYRHQLGQHQLKVQAQLTAIQPEIEAILKHPRTCQATAIQNAVNRTNWLLSEPGTWTQVPRTYAVFITDGLDSFSTKPVRLKADQTILVHGSPDVGIFNGIKHQRFESPQAALSLLANWMQAP